MSTCAAACAPHILEKLAVYFDPFVSSKRQFRCTCSLVKQPHNNPFGFHNLHSRKKVAVASDNCRMSNVAFHTCHYKINPEQKVDTLLLKTGMPDFA